MCSCADEHRFNFRVHFLASADEQASLRSDGVSQLSCYVVDYALRIDVDLLYITTRYTFKLLKMCVVFPFCLPTVTLSSTLTLSLSFLLFIPSLGVFLLPMRVVALPEVLNSISKGLFAMDSTKRSPIATAWGKVLLELMVMTVTNLRLYTVSWLLPWS